MTRILLMSPFRVPVQGTYGMTYYSFSSLTTVFRSRYQQSPVILRQDRNPVPFLFLFKDEKKRPIASH